MPLQLHPDDRVTPETYERLENAAYLADRVAQLEARLAAVQPEPAPRLDWRAILGAGLAGGVLTGVNALIMPWDHISNTWLYWLAPVVAGGFIGRYLRPAFAHGMAAGLLMMTLQTFVLYLGWPVFAELNPDVDPHAGGMLDFMLWETWRLAPGYALLCGGVAWLGARYIWPWLGTPPRELRAEPIAPPTEAPAEAATTLARK